MVTPPATAPGAAAATALAAQAELMHAWLLGLQLMVATRHPPAVMEDWMFRLFRRQHHAKFLSSFAKLGLTGLPHAVACAQYHVLSNAVGGVPVEYLAESDRKAWVRFRYPRWLYHGPVICGIPVEVSRGFLRGWYAHNGVSLQNPRLGFVCVSEDMTGEFGLCGYFREFDQPLAAHERLQFRRDERPPPFRATDQPLLPASEWNPQRLARAARNYAMEYIRNGIAELAAVLGDALAAERVELAATLIGLQYRSTTGAAIGVETDGDAEVAAHYLAAMFAGMDEAAAVSWERGGWQVDEPEPRILRDLGGTDRALLLGAWVALWTGAVRAQRAFITVAAEPRADGGLRWRLAPS